MILRTVYFRVKKLEKKMLVFQSKKHNISTVNVNKLALSCEDDKRQICTNGKDTLPYGHYM